MPKWARFRSSRLNLTKIASIHSKTITFTFYLLECSREEKICKFELVPLLFESERSITSNANGHARFQLGAETRFLRPSLKKTLKNKRRTKKKNLKLL
mmetsp:Transcript_22578/g.33665  ORF Transcript_22578/g.33665 Transcript_22578/m.33665 type:complete len:98 (-) Transcript_22578:5-298(-)